MTAETSDRGASYRAVLGVVVASTFLAMLAYTGPLGNAVTLTAAFDSSVAGDTWILASMSVGLAVTLLAAGVIADRIGRRRVFQLGVAVFVAANIACALASGAGVFVAARILAGVGATGMIATGLGLVSATNPGPRRQTTTAAGWSVAMGGGIAAGPVLVGLFDLADAWRWFYVLLAVCGVATWAGAHWLVPAHAPTPASAPRKFDALGFVLLIGFLAALIVGIVEVRTGDTAAIAALFAAAAILLAAFVASQFFGARRLIEPEVLAHRPFLAATAAGFGTGLGVIAVMSFAPTYFVKGLGMTTLQAGGLIALWSGTSAVAALLIARHTARISGPAQLLIGLVGVASGILLMVGVATTADLARLVAGTVVAGVASGLLNSGLARQSVATVPERYAATGTAANNTARYLGAAIGVSVASIMAAAGGLGGENLSAGWDRVVWSGAAASLVLAAVVAVLSARSRRAA